MPYRPSAVDRSGELLAAGILRGAAGLGRGLELLQKQREEKDKEEQKVNETAAIADRLAKSKSFGDDFLQGKSAEEFKGLSAREKNAMMFAFIEEQRLKNSTVNAELLQDQLETRRTQRGAAEQFRTFLSENPQASREEIVNQGLGLGVDPQRALQVAEMFTGPAPGQVDINREANLATVGTGGGRISVMSLPRTQEPDESDKLRQEKLKLEVEGLQQQKRQDELARAGAQIPDEVREEVATLYDELQEYELKARKGDTKTGFLGAPIEEGIMKKKLRLQQEIEANPAIVQELGLSIEDARKRFAIDIKNDDEFQTLPSGALFRDEGGLAVKVTKKEQRDALPSGTRYRTATGGVAVKP